MRQKFANNVATQFDESRSRQLIEILEDPAQLESMPVAQFMDLMVRESADVASLLA